MRNLVFAALAAVVLFCSLPAGAQTQVVQYSGAYATGVTGTLTTITTDTVATSVSGAQWATARFRVVSAGTATATTQVMISGQWVSSVYATRISTTTANPTTQAIASTTLTTGDVWEVPLPALATAFQVVCGASGTTTTVQVFGGIPYTPGMPVVATIYDATVAFAVGADSGTLDYSGWSSGILAAVDSDTGGATRTYGIGFTFDDGTAANTNTTTVATGSAGYAYYGNALNVTQVGGIMPKRGKVLLGAGTGTGGSSRITFQVRR